MTVLDAQCRARGVDSLRVIEPPIFPTIADGNLEAPAITVGGKAAAMARGRDPLASSADRWHGPRLANPAAAKPPMTARRSGRRW